MQSVLNPAAMQFHGPPPAKKPRSNLVVTKYPLPPNQVPAHTQNTWSRIGNEWMQTRGVQAQSGTSGDFSHFATTTNPPSSHFGHRRWLSQHDSIGFSGGPQIASAAGTLPPQNMQLHPPQMQSFTAHETVSKPPRRHSSASRRGLPRAATPVLDGNGEPLPPAPFDIQQDADDEFNRECYFFRRPTEIDESLSLGQIIWTPAVSTKRAISSTQGGIDLLVSSAACDGPADTISEYFNGHHRHESLRSVRQSSLWSTVKDDSIYKVFPPRAREFVSMSALANKYRCRPEPTSRCSSAPETSKVSRDEHYQWRPTPMSQHIGIVNSIEIDRNEQLRPQVQTYPYLQQPATQIELAPQPLSSHSHAPQPASNHVQYRPNHSRASSVPTTSGVKFTRPVPLMPLHDPTQEDILASLGVTGSAKLVYQTPGPAYGPPPPANIPDGQQQGTINGRPGSNPPSMHQRSRSEGPPTVQGHFDRPATAHGNHPMQHTSDLMDIVEEDEPTPRGNAVSREQRKRAFDDIDWAASGSGHYFDAETLQPHHKRQARVY